LAIVLQYGDAASALVSLQVSDVVRVSPLGKEVVEGPGDFMLTKERVIMSLLQPAKVTIEPSASILRDQLGVAVAFVDPIFELTPESAKYFELHISSNIGVLPYQSRGPGRWQVVASQLLVSLAVGVSTIKQNGAAGAADKAPDTVGLPPGSLHEIGQGGTLGPSDQFQHLGGFTVGPGSLCGLTAFLEGAVLPAPACLPWAAFRALGAPLTRTWLVVGS
jgi:hypothetical protein